MFRMLDHVTNMLDSFFLFFGLGGVGVNNKGLCAILKIATTYHF
jgi:hypothetical protein